MMRLFSLSLKTSGITLLDNLRMIRHQEYLKYLMKCLSTQGFNEKIMLKLVNLCIQVGNIPKEWRYALLYPIPKTMDWKYLLTKTRLIILLETLRKVVVKIITKRLSKTIIDHNILKGGNHTKLPEGSTEAPLRIINTYMYSRMQKKIIKNCG